MLAFAIAFTVVAFGSADALSQQQNFRDCFCWNVTADGFCGGDNFFNQETCKHWIIDAFAWTIPAILGLFVLLLFPCVFCCARTCCGCCGGRHRTYGCCCSDESSRHRFPGYTNRSIFIAKILMLTVFGGYIYYAVGGYTANSKVHTDVLGTLADVNSTVAEMEQLAFTAQSATKALIPTGATSEADVGTLIKYTSRFQKRADQIRHVLDQIRDVERNQQWGRAESVYRYPSLVLFVYLFVVIFMFCNVRKIMFALLCLVCLTSLVEGVVFIPHMVIAQGASAICDNFNETIVPMTIGAIQSQHGCASEGFNAIALNTAVWTESNWWSPTSDFCVNFQTVCTALDCPISTCVTPDTKSTSYLPFVNSDPLAENKWLVHNLYNALTAPKGKGASSAEQIGNATTVMNCAEYCAEGQIRAAAVKLVQSYTTFYAPVSTILADLYPQLTNCSAVRKRLQGPIHSDICDHSLDMRLTTVAMVLGVMYCISFLSLPVIARGMKRFVPMKNAQSIREVATETIYYVDARVNAVAPENDIDEAHYSAVNDCDDAEHALRTRDSAHFRRFYGIEKSSPITPIKPSSV